MTNNAAERAVRPLALGRKNYLFAGSDEGGRRAAIMCTLIETARLNRVDPEAWQPASRPWRAEWPRSTKTTMSSVLGCAGGEQPSLSASSATLLLSERGLAPTIEDRNPFARPL